MKSGGKPLQRQPNFGQGQNFPFKTKKAADAARTAAPISLFDVQRGLGCRRLRRDVVETAKEFTHPDMVDVKIDPGTGKARNPRGEMPVLCNGLTAAVILRAYNSTIDCKDSPIGRFTARLCRPGGYVEQLADHARIPMSEIERLAEGHLTS